MSGNAPFRPRCLVVPGYKNSGPAHWQTRWEQLRDDCERVELGSWSNPHRSHWVTKLDLAIAHSSNPVILVAHSLGCLAVAWWVALVAPERVSQIAGALLVAPPDVESRIDRFDPATLCASATDGFPFPTIVVASRDDGFATIERSQLFARRWGADFVDAGCLGHINADSFLGDWPAGLALLDRLIGIGRHGGSGHIGEGRPFLLVGGYDPAASISKRTN